ncbi:MAG: hypothetical protein MUE69_09255 [Myxococcota bacterium]|jgi:hypothetical protein|nr:hypothetical protein [Myxococcota bacterium]
MPSTGKLGISRWTLVCALLACWLLACGGGNAPPDTTPRPDADVLTFDAAMLGRNDGGVTPSLDSGRDVPGTRDAGTSDSGLLCAIGRTGTTASGTRTNFPQIDITSDPRFRVVTAGFFVDRDGDPRGPLLFALLELENVSTQSFCSLIPDAYLDGVELVGLVETPAHYETAFTSSVTADCMRPGERGFYDAVARGVDVDDLQTARRLDFGFASTPYVADSTLAFPAPTLTVEAESTPEGWRLAGTMVPPRTIRNYAMRAFARNADGIPNARLLAFPGSLGTLAGGVPNDVETLTTPCAIASFDAYQSWIDDSRRALTVVEPRPELAMRRALERRRQALIDPL